MERGGQQPLLLIFAVALVAVMLVVIAYFSLATQNGAIIMPDLAGRSLEETKVELSRLGLSLGVIDSAYSTIVPSARVIATIPRAGTWTAPRTTVDLILSLGSEGIIVPDLLGSQIDWALKVLEERGLRGMLIGEGRVVIAQDPAPSSLLSPAGVVHLTLGK
jgi:serine/threonine-protein kinase